MRVLVVTNRYPPDSIGGYELGCLDVVTGLTARGHDVRVLTRRGAGGPRTDGNVLRRLRSGGWSTRMRPYLLAKLPLREWTNQREFARVLNEFEPDVVQFWNLVGISTTAAFQARSAGLPITWVVLDDWLARWTTDPWSLRHPEQARSAIAPGLRALGGVLGLERGSDDLDLTHVFYGSEYMKRTALEAGQPVADARVRLWGVDLLRHTPRAVPPPAAKLLYAGQLIEHKGVHTALECLRLVHDAGHGEVELSLAGGDSTPEYRERLEALARELGVDSSVHFLGVVDRSTMPELYQEHGILLFPSLWEEPSGFVRIEAKAAGMAIVSSRTGAADEIISDGSSGLLFEPGDAAGCAARVLELLDSPERYAQLRENARREAERDFDFDTTLGMIEADLVDAVAGRGPRDPGSA